MKNGTAVIEPVLDPKDVEIKALQGANAELRVRNTDLEQRNTALHERNGVLSKRRDDDAVRKEAAELNTAKGALEAKLAIAEDSVKRLTGDLKKTDAEHMNEKKLLTRDLTALGKQAEEFKTARDKAQVLLRQNQLALAGKTWGPWLTCIMVSTLMFVLCYKGIIFPHSGDPKADIVTMLSQAMQVEQAERTRQIEQQKPQEVWGVSKGRSGDGKAILTFVIYMDERVQKQKKSELEFASSTILTALRYKTVVAGGGTSDPNNQEFLALAGGQNQAVIWPASLNEILSASQIEDIRLKIPEFSFGINVEFLEATVEQNHYRGFSAEFKKGKFQDQGYSAPAIPIPGGGKG